MEQIKDAPYIRQMECHGCCDGWESFWRVEDETREEADTCPALGIGGEQHG